MSTELDDFHSAPMGVEDEGHASEEGEGDVLMGDAAVDDSSEEEEEDEEEARRIAEGFIVDEEEDEEEGEDDDEEVRRHKKRRKRRKHSRRDDDEEVLEEDDLDLLEENTGRRIDRSRLTRLRRGRSQSPPAKQPKRKDRADATNDAVSHIWDDDDNVMDQDDDVEDDDMGGFIDDDDEDEETGLGEEERRARQEEKRKQLKARRNKGSDMIGIDRGAWDEITEVFGDGDDYDWALEGEDENVAEFEQNKEELRLQDVFEPSEIKARLLTEDDDLIRGQDIPERMQLLTSSLSTMATLSLHPNFPESDISDAADWVSQRLGEKVIQDFFQPGGSRFRYSTELVMAVQAALNMILCQTLEVPYIWTHRRDSLCHFEAPLRVELLSLQDLWRVYVLAQKYRALLERKRGLDSLYDRLAVSDSYYETEIRHRLDAVEMVADTTEWLSLTYRDRKKDQFTLEFHDDDAPVEKKHKAPSRASAYEIVKKTVVAKLAEGYGISPQKVVLNFMAPSKLHFVDDQEVPPLEYAEQFIDPAAPADPKDQLAKARMILATELGRDPLLRQEARLLFKSFAVLSVIPTEKGIAKINEFHPYYAFKYLKDKPVSMMLQSSQFLHILRAEADHLVTVDIHLTQASQEDFGQRLLEAFTSDSYSDTVKAWNDERQLVIREAMEKFLMPLGAKWVKEWAREEVEDFIAKGCAEELERRVNVVGFNQRPEGLPASAPPQSLPGPDSFPTILAMSWGKGDPQKDPITMVFLDGNGRLREYTAIDNLFDPEPRRELLELIKRRKPEGIVIAGFSIHTMKLHEKVKELLEKESGVIPSEGDDAFGGGGAGGAGGGSGWGGDNDRDRDRDRDRGEDAWLARIPVVYVKDEVARLYQHSARATDEFSDLSTMAKYCVGLARFAQSPLIEYCALGSDLPAITFDEEAQTLVPREKLLIALERALVNVVNYVGVDINRAVNDPYYYHLLPFVAGLGPRKAQHLKKKILAIGGTMINREQFIKVMTKQIFMNTAGFLRIPQEDDYDVRDSKRSKHDDVSDAPDPLDQTRIHPEDYELARKMATDALDMDEEDVKDDHPSMVITQILSQRDKEKKLNELNLDDFAVNLQETNQDFKRQTLDNIKSELLHPFADGRPEFRIPSHWDVVTMLTGETRKSLRVGLIVSVVVTRIKESFVHVRLASGVDGIINSQYLSATANAVTKGMTIPAVIIHVKDDRNIAVELSSHPDHVARGDADFRRVAPEEDFYDHTRAGRDKEMLQRRKRHETGQARRVIKHPNFHNFNSLQAEQYLANRERGDVVVRPSSKGQNHLAVTWKVDTGLYQHIDVVEEQSGNKGDVTGRLVVEGNYQYSDIDELIVNHVKAMARRVEELMAHEKFKAGTQDDLEHYLREFVKAYPTKSIYAFSLNRQRPGHFNISFLANKDSQITTWAVKVLPQYYQLFDATAPSVAQLTDAFKMRHLHETSKAAHGGKTPYGAGLGMTPAGGRTPGSATPGRMSVRGVGRTPNPYVSAAAPPAPGAPGSMGPPPVPGVYAGGFTPQSYR